MTNLKTDTCYNVLFDWNFPSLRSVVDPVRLVLLTSSCKNTLCHQLFLSCRRPLRRCLHPELQSRRQHIAQCYMMITNIWYLFDNKNWKVIRPSVCHIQSGWIRLFHYQCSRLVTTWGFLLLHGAPPPYENHDARRCLIKQNLIEFLNCQICLRLINGLIANGYKNNHHNRTQVFLHLHIQHGLETDWYELIIIMIW